ncbi:MAG: MerR family transcriptional regulator [Firmicutes bacterium]|nr:MerR family transcriptional regulator [Bacillota bacterium]
MKTGQFSARYNLTPNGIRYYIEQGLLTPKKKGHQYDFDEECVQQMEEIQQLKQMHYSLGEISRIFHVNGLIQHTLNADARSKYNRIFLTKISELEGTIAELRHCIDILKQSTLPTDEVASNFIAGLPVSCISMLTCPHCGQTLDFSDAEIRSNKIISGHVTCSCGYSLDITDGILISDYEDPGQMHIEWSNLLNLLSEYSTEYLNLEANSYYLLKTSILQECGKNDRETISGTIFTSGGYAGDFICKYHGLFDSSCTFIIADQSLDVLQYIKDKIGRLNDRFKIIYICDNAFHLPLRNGLIDFFLDDYSSSEFVFYNPDYPIEKIRPLLKDGALCGGVYTYYSHSAKTLATIKREYPNTNIPLFYLDTFKRRMTSNGVQIEENHLVGSTSSPGIGASFDYHSEGDLLYFYTYFGRLDKNLLKDY